MVHERDVGGVSVPFLIQADTAAITALDAFIAQAFPDPREQKRIRAYLDNPVVRPLFELIANGATSLAGARVLKSWGFIEADNYIARLGELKGSYVHAVRVTKEGMVEMDRYLPSTENDPPFERFLDAITSYVAIDEGAGIVARRELIDFAMDYDDSEILSHLVDVEVGIRQHDHLPFDTIVTAEDRLTLSSYWGGLVNHRGGAVFVNLRRS